ncbi:MarR family transcriptional regulator [Methanobrevibacter sp. TMH8]|uniref:MarR family winged helix-turn-helix transcriptional regulator n=1 Tax=Methanobrevibacter sp. TMH8 TaxID=2848611 RepID=UPI001CCC47B5|nr:MarR family transcriptional regulator [Methanobrevibacter sp. TMH8]MBZ9571424.1 MarR family transcriptional regulator [Methanobrevibacter sp. TMH8]
MEKIKDINYMSYYLNCYILILNKAHQAFISPYLKEKNVSYNQYELILHIYRDEGSIQGKIASSCGTDKCGASRSLRILEDKKLIIKKIDENNRRSYQLFLTEKGKKVVEDIIEKEIQWENYICENSDIEKEKLFKILNKACISSLKLLKND